MTIPYLMNCAHSTEGWCLKCVREENMRASEVAKALENLLGFVRLSTDTQISDCLLRSPAAEMRREAAVIEARDQAIRWARGTLKLATEAECTNQNCSEG